MTDSPSSQTPPAHEVGATTPQPGWWGRQTLLTRLLLISLSLLILSGYLMVKDLNRKAPGFDGATGWINSTPLQSNDLAGKIVLVDFWTLSCINCIRTFPYLKAWDEKYRDQGLVIVGVHTPEFLFEQTTERVETAVTQFGLRYPIALDNNREIWSAFANHWWPHKYLIDRTGKIRNEWIGEGGYPDVERAIQRLLAEGQNTPPGRETVKVSAEAIEQKKIQTPEIYFGYGFVPDGGLFALGNQNIGQLRNEVISYTLPDEATMGENRFYLSGSWKLQDEKAELMERGDAQVLLSYEAKAVHLVAEHPERTATVYVLRDGRPLDPAIAGADIQFDAQGSSYVAIDRGRMYRLINDPAGYGRHRLLLKTTDKGFAIYTLTFG
ncbi:MAG: redoxin domain-containing protein [Nitrospirae bacterium]|nr:redoxin domain-containing protein [Nitrospirota bacterium]